MATIAVHPSGPGGTPAPHDALRIRSSTGASACQLASAFSFTLCQGGRSSLLRVRDFEHVADGSRGARASRCTPYADAIRPGRQSFKDELRAANPLAEIEVLSRTAHAYRLDSRLEAAC